MPDALLKHGQVAQLLGHSADWFSRHRAQLEAQGFPRPVPGCGRRWDPAAIEAWLAAQRPGAVDEWEARLRARLATAA